MSSALNKSAFATSGKKLPPVMQMSPRDIVLAQRCRSGDRVQRDADNERRWHLDDPEYDNLDGSRRSHRRMIGGNH
jgi:hypothetical protein